MNTDKVVVKKVNSKRGPKAFQLLGKGVCKSRRPAHCDLPNAIFVLLDGLTYSQAKKALDGATELLDDAVRVDILRQLKKVPDEPLCQNRN